MANDTKIVIDTEKSVAPEGYEFTGFYGPAVLNGYLINKGKVHRVRDTNRWMGDYPSLRKKPWEPDEGEEYFFIDSSLSHRKRLEVCGTAYGRDRGYAGLCGPFKTQSAAQSALDALNNAPRGD